jgi:acetyl-CoA C-acetyltransferase
MGKIPELIEQYEGGGTIETYTVVYDKNSVELFWIVVARTNEKKRFVAITKQNSSSGRAPSLNSSRDIIGMDGKSIIQDGYNIWIW